MGEITIGAEILAGIVGIFLLLILGLLVYIVRHKRNLSELAEPEAVAASPLSRPIIGVGIIVFIILGFASTLALSQRVQDTQVEEISVSNSYKIELDVSTQATIVSSEEARVDFKVIPMVDEVPWGTGTTIDSSLQKFDVFWTVKGPKNFSQIELGLNAQQKGGFVRTIPRGDYEIKVEMVLEGVTYIQTELFSI